MWKSRALVFGAISKRGGKRGKVRGQFCLCGWLSDGLFHAPRRVISTAILPPPFASSAFGGMSPETAEVLVAGTRQPKILFPKEVKS